MKGRERQTARIPVAAGLVLLMIAGACAAGHLREKSRGTVIYFGMNAGSYWDVPTGSCYEVIDTAIRRFEEKHPGVSVEYTSGILKEDYPEWLAEQILLGREPDVFMIPSGELDILASLGVLKDLEPLMKKDVEFDRGDYYPAAWRYGNIRDTQYALPYESVPTLMFVNKTLLDKEGIDMPGEWAWVMQTASFSPISAFLYLAASYAFRDPSLSESARFSRLGIRCFPWFVYRK